MTARLLAFDTSTESMAVAVRGPGGDHGTLLPGGARASAGLLPTIHVLLAQAGLHLADIDAIAFGQGPGAFTGLRTSCAVAQGLGFGLDRPLLALDSLLLVAEDARLQVASEAVSFEVGVAMDARMDEVYASRYRWERRRWHCLTPPALYTLPALTRAWDPAPEWVAGSALTVFGARLGLPADQPGVALENDRPAALLRLAQAKFEAGLAIAAADALPLYLRDKVALTTREREALKSATR
jgi:tRNA threonylcarbamoyladenosine biosynthesis protein TsaB